MIFFVTNNLNQFASKRKTILFKTKMVLIEMENDFIENKIQFDSIKKVLFETGNGLILMIQNAKICPTNGFVMLCL